MAMSSHTVTAFDTELSALGQRIAEMGGVAEQMLGDMVDAVSRRDLAAAQRLMVDDIRLDNLQREVEEQAVLTIARRQPMAIDLREIIAAIRIANDLERVGDLVKNVGKRLVAIGGNMQLPTTVSGLNNMGHLALEQLKSVLDAYAQRDVATALEVWRRDGEIDAIYTSLFRELLTYMMEDPRHISFCTHLLFSAKNIERIGDHATNIAETVHYLVTGQTLLAQRPKQDASSGTVIESHS